MIPSNSFLKPRDGQNTRKNERKKTVYPLRALLVRTPYVLANSYSDAVAVRAVEVLSVIDGKACCRFREGSALRIETHPVESLASTPEKAAAKLAEHFAALLSRPLLQPVAGKTESTAADSSASSNVTNDAPGSAPQPLAGPRQPKTPWYAAA